MLLIQICRNHLIQIRWIKFYCSTFIISCSSFDFASSKFFFQSIEMWDSTFTQTLREFPKKKCRRWSIVVCIHLRIITEKQFRIKKETIISVWLKKIEEDRKRFFFCKQNWDNCFFSLQRVENKLTKTKTIKNQILTHKKQA